MASKIIVDQLEKTGGALAALTLPAANATADQVLENDGSGALSWVTHGVGGLTSVQKPASGPWNRPSGITKVVVEVQAGGAGGASSPRLPGSLASARRGREPRKTGQTYHRS